MNKIARILKEEKKKIAGDRGELCAPHPRVLTAPITGFPLASYQTPIARGKKEFDKAPNFIHHVKVSAG